MEAAPLLGLAVPEAVLDSLFNTTASYGFTAAHRLLRAERYDHVVHAANLTDRSFRVFFVRNGKKNARLGIVASKRILPGAVQRNHVKRMIRETFRQHSIRLQQLDLVVIVRSSDKLALQCEGLITLFCRIEEKCASS